MSQEHPSLRLLREVRRVERLAHRFPDPADPEETWVALHTFPLESKRSLNAIKLRSKGR